MPGRTDAARRVRRHSPDRRRNTQENRGPYGARAGRLGMLLGQCPPRAYLDLAAPHPLVSPARTARRAIGQVAHLHNAAVVQRRPHIAVAAAHPRRGRGTYSQNFAADPASVEQLEAVMPSTTPRRPSRETASIATGASGIPIGTRTDAVTTIHREERTHSPSVTVLRLRRPRTTLGVCRSSSVPSRIATERALQSSVRDMELQQAGHHTGSARPDTIHTK